MPDSVSAHRSRSTTEGPPGDDPESGMSATVPSLCWPRSVTAASGPAALAAGRGGAGKTQRRSVTGQERPDLLRHTRREEEPLRLMAAQAHERAELLFRLDALCDHREAEGTPEADNTGDDGRVFRIVAQPVDERAVDLHRVDREPFEIPQRRIAGAEIVHAERDPELLEPGQRLQRGPGVIEQHTLGDLEAQVLRT